MRCEHIGRLRDLQGRRASLALRDGRCLEDVMLVSTGAAGGGSVWVFADGADVFVRLQDVIDAWEPHAAPAAPSHSAFSRVVAAAAQP